MAISATSYTVKGLKTLKTRDIYAFLNLDFTGIPVEQLDKLFPIKKKFGSQNPPPQYRTSGKEIQKWRKISDAEQIQIIDLLSKGDSIKARGVRSSGSSTILVDTKGIMKISNKAAEETEPAKTLPAEKHSKSDEDDKPSGSSSENEHGNEAEEDEKISNDNVEEKEGTETSSAKKNPKEDGESSQALSQNEHEKVGYIDAATYTYVGLRRIRNKPEFDTLDFRNIEIKHLDGLFPRLKGCGSLDPPPYYRMSAGRMRQWRKLKRSRQLQQIKQPPKIVESPRSEVIPIQKLPPKPISKTTLHEKTPVPVFSESEESSDQEAPVQNAHNAWPNVSFHVSQSLQFERVDFTKFEIASLNVLFPKVRGLGQEDPPLSFRKSADTLRRWRQQTAEEQKALILKDIENVYRKKFAPVDSNVPEKPKQFENEDYSIFSRRLEIKVNGVWHAAKAYQMKHEPSKAKGKTHIVRTKHLVKSDDGQLEVWVDFRHELFVGRLRWLDDEHGNPTFTSAGRKMCSREEGNMLLEEKGRADTNNTDNASVTEQVTASAIAAIAAADAVTAAADKSFGRYFVDTNLFRSAKPKTKSGTRKRKRENSGQKIQHNERGLGGNRTKGIIVVPAIPSMGKS